MHSITRDEIIEKIEILGGAVKNTISNKTDYIIVGEKPGSKLEKAKQIGTKILNEIEFINMYNKKD